MSEEKPSQPSGNAASSDPSGAGTLLSKLSDKERFDAYLKLYELTKERHHFSSEFRMKYLKWPWVILAALAVAFSWTHKNAPESSFLLPAIGAFAVLFVLLFDMRARDSVGAAKRAGRQLELDLGLPPEARYFANVEGALPHGKLIEIYSTILIVGLLGASLYLFCEQDDDSDSERHSKKGVWKYQMVPLPLKDSEHLANQLKRAGKDGFELVGMLPSDGVAGSTNGFLLFKRSASDRGERSEARDHRERH